MNKPNIATASVAAIAMVAIMAPSALAGGHGFGGAWTFTSTHQTQEAAGHIGPIIMEQHFDTTEELWAGPDIKVLTKKWADQKQTADSASHAKQQQASTGNSNIKYPLGHFPAEVSVTTDHQKIKQEQSILGKNPIQLQDLHGWAAGKVGDTGFIIDVNAEEKQKALGSGDFHQQQETAFKGIATGFANPPFPEFKTHKFDLGDRKGFLLQKFEFINKLIFFG